MDITALVSKLKEEASVPKGRVTRSKPRRGKGARKYRDTYTEADREWQRAFWGTVSGTWKHLEKTYRSREKKRREAGRESSVAGEWYITLEDWKALWTEAGMVVLGNGERVHAFKLRGKYKDSVKLMRIDTDKPWTLDNTIIYWRGAVLANGRKLHKEKNERKDRGGEAGDCKEG